MHIVLFTGQSWRDELGTFRSDGEITQMLTDEGAWLDVDYDAMRAELPPPTAIKPDPDVVVFKDGIWGRTVESGLENMRDGVEKNGKSDKPK